MIRKIKLFRFSPVEQRQEKIIPIRWVSKFFSVTRDCDFFCYSLFKIIFYLEIICILLMLLDVIFQFGLLVNLNKFYAQRNIFIAYFSKVSGPIAFLLCLVFLIGFRTSIKINQLEITCIIEPKILIQKSKPYWIRWSAFLIVVGIILMLASHIFAMGALKYFNLEHNFSFVLFALVLPVFTIPYGAVLFAYGFLILEKSIRYFSLVESDFLKFYERYKRTGEEI